MFRFILATSALALTTACATTELEPIDSSAFVAAMPLEDDTEYPARIIRNGGSTSITRADEGHRNRFFAATVSSSSPGY